MDNTYVHGFCGPLLGKEGCLSIPSLNIFTSLIVESFICTKRDVENS